MSVRRPATTGLRLLASISGGLGRAGSPALVAALGIWASAVLPSSALAVVPNDREVPFQYGLDFVDAPEAWDLTTGSAAVKVALVDDGVDLQNPDLVGNLIPGYDFGNGDGDPAQAESIHGTQTGSLLAAAGNNAYGLAGMAWTAGLAPLKVRTDGPGTRFEQIAPTAVAAAFRYAGGQGFRVANASFGLRSAATADERAAILAAIQSSSRTLFVVSAGNGGRNNDATPRFPCNFATPNLLCVAGTDQTDGLWANSNYGSASVHLAAPGAAVRTVTGPTTYGPADGTSYAAPLVSGTAALYFSRYPSATVADARNALLTGVDPHPTLAGKTVSGGRLNALRTLTIAPAASPSAPPGGPPPVGTPPQNVLPVRPVPPNVRLAPNVTARQDLRFVLRRGVRISLSASAPTTVRVAVLLSKTQARRLGIVREIGAITVRVAEPRRAFRVRLRGSVARRLARRRTIALTVALTTRARPARTYLRAVRLTAPPR